MKVEIKKVIPNPSNPRIIKDDKFKKLVNSIKDFPQMLELRPIVVDSNMVVLGGNMRLKACQAAGLQEVDILIADQLTEEQKAEFIIKDNVGFGEWDWDLLANEWDVDALTEWGLDIPFFEEKPKNGTLAERFTVPPFTILDSRQGYWKKRKEAWHDLIGDNGETRQNTLHQNNESQKDVMNAMRSVSLLDPVLAEIANKWFNVPNGKTFDCFAGDSVFGVVSDSLGHVFTGIELRKEQADLNNERIKGGQSKYICDDGQNVLKHIEENSQDLLFSCPPYFDLEVYSDLENDASNQSNYQEFFKILEVAFTNAIKCLKENRFAFIVVGDVRNEKGEYYGFPDDISRLFLKNGMSLYNELIFIEPLGTLPQRVNNFMKNRKVGKCHQNVLVFFKGNPKTIQKEFPNIEFDESADI